MHLNHILDFYPLDLFDLKPGFKDSIYSPVDSYLVKVCWLVITIKWLKVEVHQITQF